MESFLSKGECWSIPVSFVGVAGLTSSSQYTRVLECILQDRFFHCSKDQSYVRGISRLCEAVHLSVVFRHAI